MLQAGEVKIHKETGELRDLLISMGLVTMAKKWLKVK